ncbi:hypothetical protein FBZ99_12325 [Rhizobium sp. ERR 1071]|uniref:hypothetical protein n=1 Tax=Rhizobium sp. ERR 1071 TaxID=2572677 RepID=UPI0011999ECD|nr:hypothetical protein [Rhizobium sp. ERR1071]TWB07947.1 hypothetical protein FBZ99_12325 [Rhizobium sp. ERR1071]
MLLPKSGDWPEDLSLHAILKNWARSYFNHEMAVERVVQRTISVLCEHPELLDGPDIGKALFAVLHANALDELRRCGSDRRKPLSQDEALEAE